MTIRSDLGDVGLMGSAVVQDKVTELLDVRQAILAMDPGFFERPIGEEGVVLEVAGGWGGGI